MARSRLALVPPADSPRTERRWLAVPGEHTTYRLMHVIADVDDLCRVAPVASALDRAGAFEHIAVDVSPGEGVARALEELGLSTTRRRLDVSGRTVPRRLGALLEGFESLLEADAPTAAIVYADDDPSLACALAATKQHVPVVQVLAGAPAAATPAPAGSNAVLLGRLVDMLLAADQEQAEGLVRSHVPRHRIHVVGDPLMDMIRRYARRSAAVELCRSHGVEPGSYALVAMTGRLTSIPTASLVGLSARLPVLVGLDANAISATERAELARVVPGSGVRIIELTGLAARLCLERTAGAVITDSPRIAQRAGLLGVPNRLVKDSDSEAWDFSGLRSRRRTFGATAHPLRDGGAPSRLADAIVANFARVVAAAS